MAAPEGWIGTIEEDDDVPVADESSESEDEVIFIILLHSGNSFRYHISL